MKINPTVNSYEINSENGEKSVPPATKKRRKSNLLKIQEREVFQSNWRDESDRNDSTLDENIMHTDSGQWKQFAEFEDIISDSDWFP